MRVPPAPGRLWVEGEMALLGDSKPSQLPTSSDACLCRARGQHGGRRGLDHCPSRLSKIWEPELGLVTISFTARFPRVQCGEETDRCLLPALSLPPFVSPVAATTKLLQTEHTPRILSYFPHSLLNCAQICSLPEGTVPTAEHISPAGAFPVSGWLHAVTSATPAATAQAL